MIVELCGERGGARIGHFPERSDERTGTDGKESTRPATRSGEAHAGAPNLTGVQEDDRRPLAEIGDDAGQIFRPQAAASLQPDLTPIGAGRAGDAVSGEMNDVEPTAGERLTQRHFFRLDRGDLPRG